MQVRHLVTDDPQVDMFCALRVLEETRHSAAREADGSCLGVVQFADPRNMSLRLDNELAPIGRWTRDRMDVTDVDEIIFKEHATFRPISETVLLTYEALGGRRHRDILAADGSLSPMCTQPGRAR